MRDLKLLLLSTSIIDNASQPDTRRVDWKIAISYGDNIDIAREKIIEMLNADSRVLSEPAAPMVVVSELANSAVILTVRAWTANSEYWNLTFDINEKIYKELPKHGINFPYPKLDVTIKQN